jgi:hypothetical protein
MQAGNSSNVRVPDEPRARVQIFRNLNGEPTSQFASGDVKERARVSFSSDQAMVYFDHPVLAGAMQLSSDSIRYDTLLQRTAFPLLPIMLILRRDS